MCLAKFFWYPELNSNFLFRNCAKIYKIKGYICRLFFFRKKFKSFAEAEISQICFVKLALAFMNRRWRIYSQCLLSLFRDLHLMQNVSKKREFQPLSRAGECISFQSPIYKTVFFHRSLQDFNTFWIKRGRKKKKNKVYLSSRKAESLALFLRLNLKLAFQNVCRVWKLNSPHLSLSRRIEWLSMYDWFWQQEKKNLQRERYKK